MDMKSIEQRLQRMEDIHEIEQVMNKYERYLEVRLWDELVDLFALKTPDVRADVGWGIYEGEEGIKRLFYGIHKAWGGDPKTGLNVGCFGTLFNVNPCIEIAGDGKTAKGIWGFLGAGSYRPGGQEGGQGYDKGKIDSHWNMGMRATDFIKENGQWKIWHYTVHGFFCCPFYTCWADVEDPYKIMDHSWLPDEWKPDRPSTDPVWLYTPTATVRNIPKVPEPYDTFNEKDAY